MPYAKHKPKPVPKCCQCGSTLYSRSELPAEDLLDAICFLCLSNWPDYTGPVFRRAGTSRVVAA